MWHRGCPGDKVQYPLAKFTAVTEFIQVANDRSTILPNGDR